jgi:hypothetical protein
MKSLKAIDGDDMRNVEFFREDSAWWWESNVSGPHGPFRTRQAALDHAAGDSEQQLNQQQEISAA